MNPREDPLNDSIDYPALRRIALTGWALFAVWVLTLLTWAIIKPDPYAHGWRLVLELAFLGPLVSTADGIQMDCSNIYLAMQNIPQDIILLLVCYPAIVLGYQRGLRRNFIGRRIESIRTVAERHKRLVEPFGVAGLLVFVFFPFWSTGVLVGGVVGYLLGFPTRVVFATVFAGHFLSISCLIWFFDTTFEATKAFSQGLTQFMPWIILGVLIVGTIVARLTSRLIRRADPVTTEQP